MSLPQVHFELYAEIDTCLYTSNERQCTFACFLRISKKYDCLSSIDIHLYIDLSNIDTKNLKLDLKSKTSCL